jgi:RimJ/RimL family protein N-acetyltransferase
MHRFETRRLLLREYREDELDVRHAVLDSHPDVWQYDPGRPLTREERREADARRLASYGQPVFGALAVTLRETGEFMGYCGLQLYLCERIPLSTPEVELFYKLGRDHWGRGYATEACREMIRHAFEDLRLHRIVTCTHRENARSIALLERLGMRIEPDPTDPDGVLATRHHPAFAARPTASETHSTPPL